MEVLRRSGGSSVAFDIYLRPTARSYKDGLSTGQREQVEAAIEVLMGDPYEDGLTKLAIGFPFRYDSICYVTEDFLIAYYFENAAVVTVYAIVPRLKGQAGR